MDVMLNGGMERMMMMGSVLIFCPFAEYYHPYYYNDQLTGCCSASFKTTCLCIRVYYWEFIAASKSCCFSLVLALYQLLSVFMR